MAVNSTFAVRQTKSGIQGQNNEGRLHVFDVVVSSVISEVEVVHGGHNSRDLVAKQSTRVYNITSCTGSIVRELPAS